MPHCIDDIRTGLLAGDPEALGKLYDLHGIRLHGWLTGVSGNPHLADDILQEVFLKLAREPELACQAERLEAYLFGMARNALLMALRRQRRQRNETLSEYLECRNTAALSAEDDRRVVEEALRVLPFEQREVVVLKCFDERTFADIASFLDISVNTAASRYRYGIAKLREQLGSLRHV